jgi:hypothetical protein
LRRRWCVEEASCPCMMMSVWELPHEECVKVFDHGAELRELDIKWCRVCSRQVKGGIIALCENFVGLNSSSFGPKFVTDASELKAFTCTFFPRWFKQYRSRSNQNAFFNAVISRPCAAFAIFKCMTLCVDPNIKNFIINGVAARENCSFLCPRI